MKRLMIGVCVLTVLLIAGIGVSTLFCHAHQPTARLLEEAGAAAAAGDWSSAQALSRQARQRWDAHHHLTAAFADHGPMDEIDSLFAQLEASARSDFAALCARLAALTRAMTESHSLHWWTVL